MEERKRTLFAKLEEFGKENRWLLWMLSICLIVTSLPNPYYQTFALAAGMPEDGGQYEILSVSELPEDVKSQMVAVGTRVEELELPDSLNVSYRGELYAEPEPVQFQDTESEVDQLGDAEPEVEQLEGTVTEPEQPGETIAEPEQPGETVIEPEQPEETVTEPGLEKTGEIVEAAIEGITWESAPEYDAGKEGTYIFTPVFPERYLVPESLVIPTIVVVTEREEDRESQNSRESFDCDDRDRILFAEDEERVLFAEGSKESGVIRIPAGQIERWDTRTLNEGTIIVEEGATLTIAGCMTISGNVTITGGGTIRRGNNAAYFSIPSNGDLTLGNVTVDGNTVMSDYSMLKSLGSLTLDDGCVIQNCLVAEDGGVLYQTTGKAVLKNAVIQNCSANFNGGAMYITGGIVEMDGTVFDGCSADAGGAIYTTGSINIRDVVIENCTAKSRGGAIAAHAGSKVNLYSGIYRNNRTTNTTDAHGYAGGGCIYSCQGTFNIYGGSFLDNSAANKGGCINHCAHLNTFTNIYGGIFQGNSCSFPDYAGSGGIFNSSVSGAHAELTVSGNVKFSGDGTEGSGVDGIYLDQDSGVPRKILISTTLTYPVELYVEASEGYVIAEGKDGYTFLHERDMKKIKFIDIGGSGKTWYAKLNDDKTQVIITETDPGYKNFVYYISNGAQGNVVDDHQYDESEEAFVKSNKDENGQDILTYEGRTFRGWSKNADGSGKLYQEGDSLGKMTEDVNLYAVFTEKPVVGFYSGSAGNRASEEAAIDDGEMKVEAPELEDLNDTRNPDDMADWEKAGWAEEEGQFRVVHQPGDEITLEKEEDFCGIYKKDATLTYDKNGWDITLPAPEVQQRSARVHEQISYLPAEFTVAPDVSYGDYVFAGWNTEPDGSGDYYHEGDTVMSDTNLTLYAVFTRTLEADFYSGAAGKKETRTAHVIGGQVEPIQAPELKDMTDWTRIGWTEDENRFRADLEAGQEITLTQNASYYGVYRKDVILSYDMNGGEGSQEPMANSCYANVHNEIIYQPAVFQVAGGGSRKGYVFVGWSETADGTGKLYQKNETVSITENKTLYARWSIARAGYQVEHHKQELDGSYQLAEVDHAEAVIGDEVHAKAKTYTGFTENTSHELRASSGIVTADDGLLLKLYYDRDIYEVDFDLNGAEGKAPGKQRVPYGDYLDEVEEPTRRGYHFKGWFVDAQGSEGNQWDFDKQVEKNYSKVTGDSRNPRQVTLYAKWVDETAPVLEASAYNHGFVNILDWIIRKKSLIITIPIFEEGSGVKQLEYKVVPYSDESPDVSEQPDETGSVSLQSDEKAAISLQLNEKAEAADWKGETGTISIPEGRNSLGLRYGVLTSNQGKFAAGKVQLLMKDGQIFAKITVSEDFKGNINLICTDYAGNISSEKAIQAQEGGIIVEDNAPKIQFSSKDGKLSELFSHAVDVSVEVMDDVDDKGKDKVTGGIASVTYQVDKGKKISVDKEAFAGKIVESYEFDVKVSGAGRHVLRVTAVDNAGNTNTARVEVNIRTRQENNSAGTPPGDEPKTGDSVTVQVYATLAMIAGLSYLLLYFAPDNPGITEKEKEEYVSWVVKWGKNGGIIRKLLSCTVLFVFLLYYHSIGKSVEVDWKEPIRG